MAIGRSHAQMGAWVWLVCTALAVGGGLLNGASPRAVLLAGGLVVGAAVWNDLDHHSPGVRNSFGIVTGLLSLVIIVASKLAYGITRTDRDAKSRKAHRTLTHSGVGCVIFGALFALACGVDTRYGPIPAGVLVGLVSGIGVNALRGAKIGAQQRRAAGLPARRPKVKRKRKRGKRLKITRHASKWIAFGVGFGLTVTTPDLTTGWWPWYLGGCVMLGMVVHCAGDAMTDVGIPWAWPFIREDGKRWGHGWLLPEAARFTTDHGGERVAMWVISAACSGIVIIALFGPQLAVALNISA